MPLYLWKYLHHKIGCLGVATLSCGCLNTENTAQKGRNNRTHGMRDTPTYKSWAEMWARTTNPNHPKFPTYQLRRPPDEWRDFSVFYAELGDKPEGYTLERVRNDLPYGPGNCSWIPKAEQSKNRTSVRRFKYKELEYTLADLTRLFGMTHGAMSHQHYTNSKPLHEVFGISASELVELPRR